MTTLGEAPLTRGWAVKVWCEDIGQFAVVVPGTDWEGKSSSVAHIMDRDGLLALRAAIDEVLR